MCKMFRRPAEVKEVSGVNGSATGDGDGAGSPAAQGLLWRFGTAVLDERSLTLAVDGIPVKLERKPLEVLQYLLRNAGRVVKKDELLGAVWPGRILSDSALTSCIAKLREALGDQDQSIVRTVHGFGYRFEASATSETQPPPLATAVPGSQEPPAVEHKASSQGRRQLVAIMFTDMVGYTALVQRDEALALRLLQQQRHLVRRTIPLYAGREVEVIGDAFLIEFGSALQAVECAIHLQQGLGLQPAEPHGERVALRIGLHIGDIVRPGKGVFGDSVNIASRLQAMAPEGGIAVSGPVFEQVYNKVDLAFADQGLQPLKGVERPLQVYLANAAAVGAVHIAIPRARWRRRFRTWQAAAALGVAATLLMAIYGYSRTQSHERAAATDVRAGDKSVAVLPFTNLSPAEQDRYFADAVQDSVLSKLASLNGLKVISRTSVMQYRDTKRSISEIGAALGVAHIVEGSVQRAGNRIRVTAQLISVADDRHLWAESYERDLADVFEVQSDIARRVTAAVDIVLNSNQQAALEKTATRSPEAYNLYVQAAQIEDTTDNTPEILTRIEGLLHEALALDPQFALAHAELANTHMNWYRDGTDASADRLRKAREAMETALKLDPDLSEAHTQLGFYHSEGLRDFAVAETAFRKAIALNPNAAETYEFLGLTYQDQGRWDEAMRVTQRAAELNPRHRWIPVNLSRIYLASGRFRDAVTEAGKAAALAPPDDHTAQVIAALTRFRAYGDLAQLTETLGRLPAEALKDPYVIRNLAFVAHAQGQDADAALLWENCDCPWIGAYPASRMPKELILATALQVIEGREADARAAYQKARTLIENDLRAKPDFGFPYQFLAVALAGLGEREAALAAIRQALEKTPVAEVSARKGIRLSEARVLLQLGERELAVEKIAQLLQLPTLINAFELYEQPWMRSARDHPRIQKILAERRAGVS